MVQQEQVLQRAVEGTIPVQRGLAAKGLTTNGSGRLRVDARRNLESVLRAAREVFGELGYGAPMEEVARRAGVGVGTVYRRFPSKEVLVRRIASEEVVWLTTQAREALSSDSAGAWESLADFLARAATSGAGRLLPPETFRQAEAMVRVPAPRSATSEESLSPTGAAATSTAVGGTGVGVAVGAVDEEFGEDADPARLLALLAQLVDRAAGCGELRGGVSVADVVLVLTASVPAHASADGSAAGRLLQLLLQGLRAG
ncbi:helix-turn-helix domain-containing protein [Streptacidiphilus fuscans]|uniref:Helix-turn-helix transcriptional regulator n=1 Tax=Streptacidiphilus fuscans TaxID=2789292 RepID=A0A931B7T0_9ACTN|nr:helix-turn-helix domain-containing protein [Streptacidiphilus fuscans]MBF9068475.1 helix-turn-helix transcriptional regulator [Streptacidiphilus fuscans]